MSKTHIENVLSTDGLKSLAYNRAWRQIQAIDATGITTFSYDEFGSLTNETVGGVAGTNTIERYYDGYGRSLGYGLNGVRQTTLSYDPATGRLSSMLSDGSSTPFEWSYLPGSDLKSSLSYPNGLTASWAYDANGQLLQVRNAFPTNIVSQYDYTYDAAGRRSERYNIGSAFATPDQIYYDYNERSELTNAVASIDSTYNFSYGYDEIGNRLYSVENTNETAYTANNLNQYTAIEEDADTFVPQFDADGNQTLIKTKTGIWTATYNGENRPVYWSNGATNIVMSFDRMGRRVQYLETAGATTNANNTFTYDNYLCVARYRLFAGGIPDTDRFVWNPTEPVATRPLVFNYATAPSAYYTQDGNKNVSELVRDSEDLVAHYEYEAFGTVCVETGDLGVENPWRFSSEYGDSELGLVYYNYRHYEPTEGHWTTRDTAEDGPHCYMFARNSFGVDVKGLSVGDIVDAVVNGVIDSVKVVGDGVVAAGNNIYYGGKVVVNSIGAVMIIPTSIVDGELLNDMRYSDPNRGVYFGDVNGFSVTISVNGMANDDGIDFSTRLKEQWNEIAKPYHNPSNFTIPYLGGPGVGDVLQSLFYELGLQDSASIGLADVIEKAHERLKGTGCHNPCIKVYAHSQGTMLARRAFDWLKYSPFSEAKPLESILFCGYGGETHIDANEFGLRGAENIINSGDPIRVLPSHWGQPTSGDGGHPFTNYVRNAKGN